MGKYDAYAIFGEPSNNAGIELVAVGFAICYVVRGTNRHCNLKQS